jgi:hypothetical protein
MRIFADIVVVTTFVAAYQLNGEPRLPDLPANQFENIQESALAKKHSHIRSAESESCKGLILRLSLLFSL